MKNEIKIAVCVSGQIRTWKECINSWFLLFQKLQESEPYRNKKIVVDYFIHTWDFDSSPQSSLTNDSKIKIEEINKNDIDEIIEILKPKKILVENKEKSETRINILNEESKKYNNNHSVIDWSASQLYGIMMVGHLKKEYEIFENFQYDICMRFRFDLFFSDLDILLFSNEIPSKINENTIYSIHSRMDHGFPYEIIGDVFFYSDSVTYDILCSLYEWVPFLKLSIFPNDITIEKVFAYFLRMMKIKVKRHKVNVEIKRKTITNESSSLHIRTTKNLENLI